MTPIRHITIDCLGRVYEVTDMFDRFAKPTLDPVLAFTCVIIFGGTAIHQDADDFPIYTVH